MTPTTDRLAGGSTTTTEPSTGGARQAQDAAAGRAPVARRGRPSPAAPAAGEGPPSSRPAGYPFHLPGGASTHPLAAAMSERELEGHVRRIIKDCRLLAYHTHDSRHSAAGFPDWVIAGDRIVFRELKKQNGIVTAAQQQWLDVLALAGLDADVWRPADLLSGRIARELAAISGLQSAGGAS